MDPDRETTTAPLERAGRRELIVLLVMLAAASVVLALSWAGRFESMMRFPLVFAVLVVLGALWSLRTAPTVLRGARITATVALAVVALAAPLAHGRGIERARLAREQAGVEALVGRPAPPIPALATVDAARDESGRLRLEGRLTVLNFWADWCGACVAELPELAAFRAEHAGTGLDVVGVTRVEARAPGAALDEELAGLRGFLGKLGLELPLAVVGPDAATHGDYAVRGLPTTVLVDRDGRVADFGAGVRGTRRVLERARELARGPG